jgi:hypothetical protein
MQARVVGCHFDYAFAGLFGFPFRFSHFAASLMIRAGRAQQKTFRCRLTS